MGMRRYRPRACQSLSCLWNTVAKSRGSPLADQDTPSLNGPERGPLPLRTLGKPDGSCSEGPDGVPLGFPKKKKAPSPIVPLIGCGSSEVRAPSIARCELNVTQIAGSWDRASKQVESPARLEPLPPSPDGRSPASVKEKPRGRLVFQVLECHYWILVGYQGLVVHWCVKVDP